MKKLSYSDCIVVQCNCCVWINVYLARDNKQFTLLSLLLQQVLTVSHLNKVYLQCSDARLKRYVIVIPHLLYIVTTRVALR